MGPATCEARWSETATGARSRRLRSPAVQDGENLDRESPIHSPIPIRPLLPNPRLSSSPMARRSLSPARDPPEAGESFPRSAEGAEVAHPGGWWRQAGWMATVT
jgi:hypothetical protein